MTTATIKPGLLVDPFTPIGHTAFGPIFHAQGGRGSQIEFVVGDDEGADPEFDDEDDDDEDDDDEDEEPRSRRRAQARDDLDDPDDDAEWTPPTREQWKRMEEAVTRNNHELRKRRVIGKQLNKLGIDPDTELEDWLRERGIDPDTGQRLDGKMAANGHKPAEGDEDDDAEVDQKSPRDHKQALRQAEQRGAARAEMRYKSAVTVVLAENALRAAGWSGDNLGLALKLIDPEEIELDFDEGELVVEGIDEQIETIRSEFPQWFRPKTPRARRAGTRDVAGGNRGQAPAKPQTWQQQIANRLKGA